MQSNIRNRQLEDTLVLLANILEVLDQIRDIVVFSGLLSLLVLGLLESAEQASKTELVENAGAVAVQRSSLRGAEHSGGVVHGADPDYA